MTNDPNTKLLAEIKQELSALRQEFEKKKPISSRGIALGIILGCLGLFSIYLIFAVIIIATTTTSLHNPSTSTTEQQNFRGTPVTPPTP